MSSRGVKNDSSASEAPSIAGRHENCPRLATCARAYIAVAMAWSAGFVDAVGWLLLAHVYTSHMTGNTASLASDIARGHWAEVYRHGWPLIPFVAGLLYSAAATALARRRSIHASFSIALTTELVLLGAFMALRAGYGMTAVSDEPPAIYYVTVSCLAGAMGMQTVTVTNVAGLRVYTTYLTGSLSKFAEAVTQYAVWFYDRTRGRFRRRVALVLAVTPRVRYARHAAITCSLWIGFFAGALCGTMSERRYGWFSVLFPMIVLGVTVGIDLWRPVAAADEPAARDSAH